MTAGYGTTLRRLLTEGRPGAGNTSHVMVKFVAMTWRIFPDHTRRIGH
jgi:hypothetical protein